MVCCYLHCNLIVIHVQQEQSLASSGFYVLLTMLKHAQQRLAPLELSNVLEGRVQPQLGVLLVVHSLHAEQRQVHHAPECGHWRQHSN
jgi:hypothetical protein